MMSDFFTKQRLEMAKKLMVEFKGNKSKVAQEDLRCGHQRPGEHRLLLVAAGELQHPLVRACQFDVQGVNLLRRRVISGLRPHHAYGQRRNTENRQRLRGLATASLMPHLRLIVVSPVLIAVAG